MHRTTVSPVQMAPISSPGLPACPPPSLVSVTQVEAISQAVMVQMSGMLERFQAQVFDFTAMVSA